MSVTACNISHMFSLCTAHVYVYVYGVATMSRLLQIIRLFCRI